MKELTKDERNKYLFAKELRSRKRERGLTNMKLGEILDVDHSYIARLESGERFPGKEMLKKIFEFYDFQPADRLQMLEWWGLDLGVTPEQVEIARVAQTNGWTMQTAQIASVIEAYVRERTRDNRGLEGQEAPNQADGENGSEARGSLQSSARRDESLREGYAAERLHPVASSAAERDPQSPPVPPPDDW